MGILKALYAKYGAGHRKDVSALRTDAVYFAGNVERYSLIISVPSLLHQTASRLGTITLTDSSTGSSNLYVKIVIK